MVRVRVGGGSMRWREVRAGRVALVVVLCIGGRSRDIVVGTVAWIGPKVVRRHLRYER